MTSGRTKTHETFLKEVFELVGNEYEILSEYKRVSEKLQITHRVCSHKYEVRPNDFLRGKRCPNCFGSKRKTTDQFKQEVFDIVGDKYSVTGNYTTTSEKIEMKHNECGYEYVTTPNSFLKGTRCPSCSNKITQLSNSEYKRRLAEQFGDEYLPLSDYKTAKLKVIIKHLKCNFRWEVTPTNLWRSKGCPKCNNNFTTKKTHEDFIKELRERHGDDYSAISEYKNLRDKVLIKHESCGHEWLVSPVNILKKSGCPKCYGRVKKTTEQYKREVYAIVKHEYSVLGKYVNSIEKITMKHNSCGNIYEVNPASFLKGRRCAKCNSSIGEKRIQEWLDFYGVNYEKEYVFSDCKYRKQLPFDFALFDEHKDIKLLIEFDGRQHFESIDFFGGEDALKENQKRDYIKNEYCNKNKIPLLRIPYTKINDIEDILEEVIVVSISVNLSKLNELK